MRNLAALILAIFLFIYAYDKTKEIESLRTISFEINKDILEKLESPDLFLASTSFNENQSIKGYENSNIKNIFSSLINYKSLQNVALNGDVLILEKIEDSKILGLNLSSYLQSFTDKTFINKDKTFSIFIHNETKSLIGVTSGQTILINNSKYSIKEIVKPFNLSLVKVFLLQKLDKDFSKAKHKVKITELKNNNIILDDIISHESSWPLIRLLSGLEAKKLLAITDKNLFINLQDFKKINKLENEQNNSVLIKFYRYLNDVKIDPDNLIKIEIDLL